jgi:pimeloyl-ACP methyl ester carboxylesterase
MRLRLYHHPDGARVAYREAGTGPGLALLHSLGLSHREWARATPIRPSGWLR